MKTKNKTIAMVEIAIVLCSLFLVAMPAIAADQTTQEVSANTITTASEDDYVLGVYGNANEDDTIDMRDLTYVKLIFFGKKPETELADAKYDGKINPLDFIQIKLIIVGKEKELTFENALDPVNPKPPEAVTVHKPVKRIVSMYYDSPEVLRALNAADKIVGITGHISNTKGFFPKISKLPSVGALWMQPDYEAILSLNPDVLMEFSIGSVKKEKLPGVTVIYLRLISPVDIAENVRKIGYILDKEEEAEELIHWSEGGTNKIKSRTEGLSEDEKPRVFIWGTYTPGGGYSTINKANRIYPMCVIAGGKNIAEDLPVSGNQYPVVDAEWVINKNPDIIVVRSRLFPYGYDIDDLSEMAAAREEILNRPELANVAAVKNGRVYIMMTHYTNGPASLMGTAYMAKWFHPDLFKDLDPKAIHQEYLDSFHKDLNFDVYEHGVFVYPPLAS